MASLQTNSRFALAPQIGNVPRSRFVRDQKTITSFDVGEAIPFYVDEVLPGDNFSVDTSKVVRLQTLLTPIFDDLYLDTWYFFVPARLTWTHWKEFMGENTESAWIPQTEYSVPQITAPQGGWNVGTIADYFGIPTGVENISVSALPFRALALIYDYFLRDENLTDPLNIPTGDSNQTGSNGSDYVNDVVNGGKPFLAAKFHDYFSSCTPNLQKGNAAKIPMGTAAPVFTGMENEFVYPSNPNALHMKSTEARDITTGNLAIAPTSYDAKVGNVYSTSSTPGTKYTNVYPANLYADLSQATAATITQLRQAIAIQQFYESLARTGSRYSEILKGQFHVTSPDGRLQNPEYLGGNRISLSISQSVQNSETGTTPQGNTAGYSVTADSHSDFTHGFTEHGYVIGIMCARYKHSYQQGIERFWSRKTRFQYYWPAFNGLSDMAVLKKEIMATGTSTDDDVFGYQEQYADYRYKPNKITGEMRSSYSQSLDIWHLADDYETVPSLSDAWIREDASVVDRVLAVSSRVSNQLMADIYVRNISTRSMPVYNIPGLERI